MNKATVSRLDFSHKRHQPVSMEVERVLCERIAKGDRGARDRLINANMKFVVAVAKRYQGKGVPFDDLVSEGAAGLIVAADRFQPGTCNRFISYAVWWIRQHMLVALNTQGKGIRTPSIGQLGAELKAAESKGKPELVELVHERIAAFHRMRDSKSLEEMHEAGFDLVDEYADPAAGLAHRDIVRQAERALSVLRPDDRDLIRRYYGFHQGFASTLDEVGERLGVTRERIRQRKESGMRKMRYRINLIGRD